MSVEITVSGDLTNEVVCNYFGALVNQFFKILPMRESNEESLLVYMESLRDELIGCKELIVGMDNNPFFLSLINILQFMIKNPNCPVGTTKREVFKAISICNKLKAQFSEGGDRG